MAIEDLASKLITKVTSAYGKKIQKTVKPPIIDTPLPVVISGSVYRMGFARREINPENTDVKTYWIAGHGSGHKMEGTLSPVYVHAVYLDCGGNEGIVWLSADIIGLTNIEVEIIRKRILAQPEMKFCKSVNFSSTHSHSGIDTVGYWGKANALKIPSNGKDSEYMEKLFSASVAAAIEAFGNKTPGKLFSGAVKIPDGLFTKRHLPNRHEVLTRLRFAPDNGANETWILNIGAHPNSLGGNNRMCSGEFPYFMREKLKDETGADVLFGVGAIGGMDAAKLDENNPENCIILQAKMYADAAKSINDEIPLSPDIKLIRKQFLMPVDNSVLTLLAIKGTMSFKPYPCAESATGIATKTEITYIKLGTQKILLLPGENFVSTVYGGYEDAEHSTTGKGSEINPAPLAEIAKDNSLIVFGVTNDMTGYVVPPNDFVLNATQPYLNGGKDRFGDNHYHETNSMGPNAQKAIADAFESIAAKI